VGDGGSEAGAAVEQMSERRRKQKRTCRAYKYLWGRWGVKGWGKWGSNGSYLYADYKDELMYSGWKKKRWR